VRHECDNKALIKRAEFERRKQSVNKIHEHLKTHKKINFLFIYNINTCIMLYFNSSLSKQYEYHELF
jgi:hypothetical protein